MEAIANIVPGKTTNSSTCKLYQRGWLRDTVESPRPGTFSKSALEERATYKDTKYVDANRRLEGDTEERLSTTGSLPFGLL